VWFIVVDFVEFFGVYAFMAEREAVETCAEPRVLAYV
jgi:hypothetical protein